MATFSKVTERSKLKPRRDPYWQKLLAGCYLGYRKMTASSEGNWSARYLDETKTPAKQVYKALGDFSTIPDHQRHDAAKSAAETWFKHLGKGGSSDAKTIKDVCDTYVTHVRDTKGEKAANDARKRFAVYVLNKAKFASLEVGKLTPAHIDGWLKELKATPTRSGKDRGSLRSPSTLNRDVTPFRAALNLALESAWVTSDFPWRAKLKPVQNADQQRSLYLDRVQRAKFVSCAAPDIAQFLRGMSLLPVRPGALAMLTVGDFDQRLSELRIKQDKTGARKIQLPTATAKFFKEATKDKLPAAPLLARADGAAWNKDSWKGPIKDAALAANLPEGTSAYTLRHSVISDLVHGGLDLLTVAQISGTGVRMVEKHYGHLRGSIAAKALATLAL